MEIRPATENDADQIAAIWNHYIRDTIATFNPVEKSSDEIKQMLDEKRANAEPFCVATISDTVAGFATYGAFRGGEGYRFVKEHTIQLRPEMQGRGLGRMLMDAIEAHVKSNDIQSLFAGISAENEAAVKFHSAIGFQHVGKLERVGWKFDRWHDLILMRKEM